MDAIYLLLVIFVVGFMLFHKPIGHGDHDKKSKDGKDKFGGRKGGGGHR